MEASMQYDSFEQSIPSLQSHLVASATVGDLLQRILASALVPRDRSEGRAPIFCLLGRKPAFRPPSVRIFQTIKECGLATFKLQKAITQTGQQARFVTGKNEYFRLVDNLFHSLLRFRLKLLVSN